jgi:predicted nucleic acid-binding protein
VTLLYADASALVKLVRDEPETAALRAFVGEAALVSSELALAEVPRAIRRAAADDPRLAEATLLEKAANVLDALAFVPLERPLLIGAGALDEPRLRTLDALHVVAAAAAAPIDAFVTYDERQAAAARLAGFRTVTPQ